MLRALIVVFYLAIALTIELPYLGILWLVKKKNRELADRLTIKNLRRIARCVMVISGVKLTVEGRDNIPKDEAVLYVGNHTSYFDIIVTLADTSGLLGYVAKLELGRIPSLRKWMKMINCVFLDRDDIRAGMQVILTSIENIKKGISVFIFPEGTRFHEDHVQEFKAGSFKIATKTGCPIVPVAIRGGDDVFEKHVPRVTPADVLIRYGTPIYPEEIAKEDKKKIHEIVRKQIDEMLRTP